MMGRVIAFRGVEISWAVGGLSPAELIPRTNEWAKDHHQLEEDTLMFLTSPLLEMHINHIPAMTGKSRRLMLEGLQQPSAQ